MSNTRIRSTLIACAAIVGTGLGGFGIAAATTDIGGDEVEGPDTPIAAGDIDQASAAALAHTGEGTVTGTEVGDEESYYEVEVTLDDGTEVDVQLDENFNVVGSEAETGNEADDN